VLGQSAAHGAHVGDDMKTRTIGAKDLIDEARKKAGQ
jgi:hypothetical protein